jgi:DNA-binding NtrC family response regulator
MIMVKSNQRILIVDDDAGVLFILRGTLERMDSGYRIVAVNNGNQALAKIKEESFDLVITDVRMPGIDGIQLVEIIRDLNMETAVIWITAYGCSRLQTEREHLNVHCCLDKPLRIHGIRQAVREALGIKAEPKET